MVRGRGAMWGGGWGRGAPDSLAGSFSSHKEVRHTRVNDVEDVKMCSQGPDKVGEHQLNTLQKQ